MKFKAFVASANTTQIEKLNSEVNQWIDEQRQAGLVVVERTVHVERQSGSVTVHPTIVITIWVDEQKAVR